MPSKKPTRAQIDDFLTTLDQLDFGPLVYKLTEADDRPVLSLEQALDAVQKYKGFLYLYFISGGETLSPSRYIDHVWHTHLVDTELYLTHSLALFGHYLHHFPFFGKRSEADEEALLDAADRTIGLAARHFGWDEDDWCGTKPKPRWPRPFPRYLSDLTSVLFPASALGSRVDSVVDRLTVEAGGFRQTIEYLGSAKTEPIETAARSTRVRRAKPTSDATDPASRAARVLRWPKEVVICKPIVTDAPGVFESIPRAELIARQTAMAAERLSPTNYSPSQVKLDVSSR